LNHESSLPAPICRRRAETLARADHHDQIAKEHHHPVSPTAAVVFLGDYVAYQISKGFGPYLLNKNRGIDLLRRIHYQQEKLERRK